MFRSLLILAVLFSFSLNANAQTDNTSESILSGLNARGEKVFLVRYQEDRVWRVDEIVQHADGWQDRVSRKYFTYRWEAEQAQAQLQTRYAQVQAVNPLMQMQSNELVLQGGSLWPTTQAWSWEWEKKYAQWLTANMNADFYTKYKIATDCADVAYSARWIFARIYGLPAANRLSGTGTTLTNQSMRPEWQSLPTAANWYEDKRFRAALNYLLDNTYTHVLMRDSYPIAITPENFLPGVHHLDVREVSGHTQLVHRVDLSDTALVPYLIVQSTTPRKVRSLNESLSWGSDQAKKGQNGFLRLLWPKVKNGVYTLEKPENMPGYSLEQYATDFIREKDRPNFLEVLLRLKPNLNFVTLVKTGYENLKDMFKNRVTVVDEGFAKCPKRSCAPDSQLFDDWSTPSRDKHITETIAQLEIFDYSPLPEAMRKDVAKVASQARSSVALNLNGEDYQLKSLIFAWKSKLFSSDPNDEPGVRWGIAPEFLSQKIQKDFSTLLTARKTKISNESDNLLRENLVIANTYCVYFGDAQCLRFRAQELTKPISLVGQTRSLQEWLEFSLWFNADAQQTPANQWGGLRATSKYQRIPVDVETFFVTKTGLGFLKTKGETRVGMMGINGLQDEPLPGGYVWLTVARQSSVAWAFAPGSLLRQDFVNGTQTVFAVPQLQTAKIVRPGSQSLLLESDGELWSLQVQGGQLAAVWHGPVNAGHLEGDYYFSENAGQWNILDFTQPVPKITLVGENLSKAKVFKGNANYVGLTANMKQLIIEKATGVVHDITALGPSYLWSEGLSRVLLWSMADKGVMDVVLDGQFNVVSKKKVGDWANISGNTAVAMSMTGPARIFQMVGEDLKEMPMRSDETGIRDWSMPWIVARLKTEGQFRLRNVDGSKTLYEGGPMMLIGHQETPEWIFSGSPADPSLKVVSVKNPKGASYLSGQFFAIIDGMMFSDNFTTPQTADRGLVLNYQGVQFWVEL